MPKLTSLFIGRRYASLGERNLLVGIISSLSVLGLAIGVAILITVMSVMNGFDRELRQRILGMVPHMTVTSLRGSGYYNLERWQDIQRQLNMVDGVSGSAPQLQLQGMLLANGRSKGVLVNSIIPAQEREVSIIDEFILNGALDELEAGEFRILIGQGVARELSLATGDFVSLVSTTTPITPLGEFTRQKRFTVAGIFTVGSQLDSNLAMIHIEDAQRLYRLGDKVQGLRIQVEDLFAIDAIIARIADFLPDDVAYSDWTRDYGNIYQNIRLSKTLVGLLLFLLVAVAAYNVIVSLVMVVKDKEGDIAILRAMGTPVATIRNIFLVQGFIIGAIGTLAGLVAGIFLALTVSDFVAWLEDLLGIEFLSADIYPVNYLPSQIQLHDLLVVCFTALVLSLVATLYPAFRAARVNPAEILRHE